MKRKHPDRYWRVLAFPNDGSRFDVHSRDLENHMLELVAEKPEVYRHREGPTQIVDGEFDELVLGDWLHLEQMGRGQWWMSIGGYHFWVVLDRRGGAKVTNDGRELGSYGLLRDQ